MIKSIKKKITAILLLTITLISNVIPIIPALKSIAVSDNYIGRKLDIVYAGETPHLLKHRNLGGQQYVNTALSGYYENGVFYPAYCIEKNEPGVDKTREYSVTLSEIMADKDTYNKIWRAATAGYPYHTAEELGVSDWRYAYQATKMAIYCVLGQSELDKFYADNAEGQAIVDLIHRLVNEGLNGTNTYRTPVANVNKSGNLTLSGNYYIQNYTISSNLNIKSYDIAITGFPSGTITTNTSGTSKSTFNAGETFQVRIPKNNVETGDINGRVRATVSTKSYAVFYGTCATEEWQDYAVTGDPISLTSASANMDLKGNTASIEIKKVDKETNKPIADTVFQLSKKDGTIIGTATTNSNGIARFNNLYQSTYVVKEIKSNDNYVVMQETINVDALYNKTVTQTIGNEHKKGNIRINKTDSETSEPVKDVKFQLLDLNGNVIQTGTTDSNGILMFNNIRTGNYKLKEVETNKNYVLNTSIFDVKVEYGKTTIKDITNEYKKGNIKINKIDAETLKGIEGVTFELQKKDGTVVATATTNDRGEAFFNNIRIGEYNLKEVKTNINYILNTANFEVAIEYNKTINKEITNEHKRGNLSVFKVDKDNNKITLGNVKFDLFSYEFNKVIGSYVTNVDGEIHINNLRIGKYSLIEKNTGKWYNLADNTDVKVEWNTTTDTTIENELKKGKIRVTKVDLDNNEIVIPNVTFEVLDDKGKVLEEIITNENGIAETSRFAIRDYATLTLKETKTDKWYVLNDKEIKIELKENDVVNIQVENELKKGQIRVIKVDLDNNEVKLKGVEFNVIDEKGNIVDKLITDENGEAVSKRLPINQKYRVQESLTLQDYVLNEEIKTVTLEQDQITDITFTNELKKGQVRVIKVDFDNNEIKLKGVEFNVIDEKGNIVDKLVTDENGEAVSKRLPINQEYKVQESKTLENYVLNDEIKTIKLEQDQITDITFTNELKKGQIRIIKVDLYNNEVRLKGVEFELLDENGNVIEKLVTDENGEAVSERHRIDKKYTLQEIKTLEKYDLNEEIKTIVLEQDQITDITFTNELKKGQIRVIKVDLDNNEVKLKGIEFNVLDESGNIVDKLITDENGEAVSKLLKVNQKYTLQETKTLENYVLNEETQVVTLQPAEITNITFENEKIKGYIEITKISEDDNQITGETKGALLEGATFEIYSDKDELVDTVITDNTGKAISKLLEYGKYYVLEKDTGSDYYLLNTNRFDIYITENLVKVPITIENKSVEIGLDIDKNGIIQAQPNDEIKYGFNSLKNTSNVSLDNFTWIDNLPYEYIRITKLFTGTYNEDLDYIVKYKTNKSEDYIEFGKYNTQKNNYIDFTKVELLEDEYITDYKVEFGTVMPGFEAVEKPFIFAKVLPTVKADDKWINNTSLTGNYKEHELEDKADWTTISYAKELKIKKLPKTGF